MKKNQLGKTDLRISSVAIGTMTFGEQNSTAESHEQLDYAFERGVNFIDTAEMYPVPPHKETYGKTEEIIGLWPKLKSQREKIILATKCIGYGREFPYIREGENVLDKKSLKLAVDASLLRLKTDYIDLYQIHWPMRSTNYFGRLGYIPNDFESATPILETLTALKEICDNGKIRHIGVSNETPWGLSEYLRQAKEFNLPLIQSIQNPYNLLNRSFEIGLAEFSHREQISLLAYSPLAMGMLTGKYLQKPWPLESRFYKFTRFTRYLKPNAFLATEKYVNLARSFNLKPEELALAFIMRQPLVTSTIIGATNRQQLETNINASLIKLPEECLLEIEKIHTEICNPCP